MIKSLIFDCWWSIWRVAKITADGVEAAQKFCLLGDVGG